MNNKNDKQKNSHKQLPKSVLKKFSTREYRTDEKGYCVVNNMIYRMDMQGNMTYVDIKKANAEKGYYEMGVEKQLSYYESAFGEVTRKIIKMCTNKSQNKHIITSKDLTTIRKYCALCIIRSELFVDAVRRHSDYIDLIANEPQNIVAGAYFDESEIIDNFFNDFNFTVLTSSEEGRFILPQSGIIVYPCWTDCDIIIPISTKVAIWLAKINFIDDKAKTLYAYNINDKVVDLLNKKFVEFEKKYNKKAIYAQNKYDLEKYREFLISAGEVR